MGMVSYDLLAYNPRMERHPAQTLITVFAVVLMAGHPIYGQNFARVSLKDIPANVKDAIAKATKQAVFPVVGITPFSGQVLKADKVIFQPGSALVLTGLRAGDSLIIIAGEVVLQDPELANKIIRDTSFSANPGISGPAGSQGVPNYVPPNETFRSANGGPGGNGGNGGPGEIFKPPIVYILVDKMTHPMIPSRFVIDFGGIQGGKGGAGGNGGNGGHGDVGYSASCGFLTCNSGPGKGGDGGPGRPRRHGPHRSRGSRSGAGRRRASPAAAGG